MKKSNVSGIEQLTKSNKLKVSQLIQRGQNDQIKGGGDVIIVDVDVL